MVGGDDDVAGARCGGGMASWVVGMVVDRVDRRMAGGEIVAGTGVRVYRGHCAGADWIGDRGMDLFATRDCAREYIFVFTGGSDGRRGGTREHCASVFRRAEEGVTKRIGPRLPVAFGIIEKPGGADGAARLRS